jgi:hypothetical protein
MLTYMLTYADVCWRRVRLQECVLILSSKIHSQLCNYELINQVKPRAAAGVRPQILINNYSNNYSRERERGRETDSQRQRQRDRDRDRSRERESARARERE